MNKSRLQTSSARFSLLKDWRPAVISWNLEPFFFISEPHFHLSILRLCCVHSPLGVLCRLIHPSIHLSIYKPLKFHVCSKFSMFFLLSKEKIGLCLRNILSLPPSLSLVLSLAPKSMIVELMPVGVGFFVRLEQTIYFLLKKIFFFFFIS